MGGPVKVNAQRGVIRTAYFLVVSFLFQVDFYFVGEGSENHLEKNVLRFKHIYFITLVK